MTPDAQRTVDVIRARGWQAVRLVPREKHPSGPVWAVTKEAATVASWFETGHGVGIVCHESAGLAVFDIDHLAAYEDLCRELGTPLGPAQVSTRPDRFHIYTRWIPGLPAKLKCDGVTVGEIQRGPGQQQVVAPGSVHPEPEGAYRWLITDVHFELVEIPTEWQWYVRRDGP